jgi:hypothetical protein
MASSSGTIWKIAIGVFIGVSACLLATCTVLGTMGYAIQEQRDEQAKQAVANFIATANDPDPMGLGRKVAEQQRAEAERQRQYDAANRPAPLAADERCVGKTRLRRIANGWVQSGSCY